MPLPKTEPLSGLSCPRVRAVLLPPVAGWFVAYSERNALQAERSRTNLLKERLEVEVVSPPTATSLLGLSINAPKQNVRLTSAQLM